MKMLTRKSKSLLLLFLIAVIVAFASISGMAQFENSTHKKPVKDITDSVLTNYDILKKEFGENKVIPATYEKQIIYALSYFPELVHAKIDFEIEKSNNGIISTKPEIGSLLRQSRKRSYIVTIYDSTADRPMPAFSNADINGQVGILGHELCHIVYFSNCTGFGLMGLGISHISSSYIDRWEYQTDSMDIEKGLGYQLLAWKQYLTNRFKAMRPAQASAPDKPGTRRRYMSVEQIKDAMAKNKWYR